MLEIKAFLTVEQVYCTIEFGASIEVGRTIELAHDLTLDPSVGLYYTQVNFDDADDNVGKHYEWDDI
ncbi:MAG: autotransporter outer membrane beta-barrel domain-containing protein, partial [Rhodospirillales bacterium]|nr:autotransporter outer membrane beta-barrel domain-containing protein [Rhodospirillales bacterium]